ncbi:ATPase [Solibacillus sp. A46]|uniref:ATPase n=1 Tax=Solibacillus faecavium TaxID=2762221 RepID=A0ABR8XWC5_9BACL|nr:ATPase [Solibacillus faecavium]MBD8036240.1 ATPase [Solibacillus faecavium]
MTFQNLIALSLVIPIVVSFITLLGFYLYYRKKPKVDKGFKFAYYALSYRRKFWRTVYSMPICIISIGVIYLTLGFSKLFIFITFFITILFAIQATYNYVMWQRELKQ